VFDTAWAGWLRGAVFGWVVGVREPERGGGGGCEGVLDHRVFGVMSISGRLCGWEMEHVVCGSHV
jgi:hypothetical protein